MYRKTNTNQTSFEDFHLPFGGKLRSDNRWVILSKQIPWEVVEQEYAAYFSEEMGSPAKSSRIAFGTLILKERLGISDRDDEDPPGQKGKLIVDATCTPADIKYPTDLSLLNEAREKSEAIIDHLYSSRTNAEKKPRTYRKKARRDYLRIAKMRKPGRKKIRQGVGKQLRYLRRNLASILVMVEAGLLVHLKKSEYRDLLVIQELFRQQQWMYAEKSHRIPNRIVSIRQPHVRPIIRGKAGREVEFGAKISVSLVNGMSFVDRIDWETYNESGGLLAQIDAYRRRFGHDPASVHADKRYRTRENRRICKSRGIRLSGPPLGRPRKTTAQNAEQLRREKHVHWQDEVGRIAIEGKFGQGKRRFGLARIMAKLAHTSEVMIMISFMVMNLEVVLSKAFLSLVYFYWRALEILRMSTFMCEGQTLGMRFRENGC